jgi:hypothetical protein
VTGVHTECITGSGVILRVDSDRCDSEAVTGSGVIDTKGR